MGQLYANNVELPLAAQVLANAFTIELPYPECGHLPVLDTSKDDYYMLTIHNPVIPEERWEVIKVTSVSGTTFKVERAQEGTDRQAWAATDMVSMRLTSESIERIRN